MITSVTAFRLSKAGNTTAECEDAFYPVGQTTVEGPNLRFAVADGASEGMLSGKWAELLVETFGAAEADAGQHYALDHNAWLRVYFAELDNRLGRAAQTFNNWRDEYLKNRQKPIQWFEEPGLESGAFASILQLSLNEGHWEAIAVGDSCLFQVREKSLVRAFPLMFSYEFGSRPLLLCSNQQYNRGIANAIKTVRGDWQPDDVFYMMTDALACWFLQEVEAKRSPWDILDRFEQVHQTEFEGWLNSLRGAKQMRNDDVTLVRIAFRQVEVE